MTNYGVPEDAIILYAYCRPDGISGKYRLKVRVTDPDARTQIGLGGKIAQVLHHRLDIIDGDRLASGRIPMTESELTMAGDFDADDVRQTIALVRRFWPRMERTAVALVQHTVDRFPQHPAVK